MVLPKQPIYLDYAATTPVDPKVIDVMTTCLGSEGAFGNPASRSHVYGWQAEAAVENARGQLADMLKADTREIVWTSGATEANNLALKGAFQYRVNAQDKADVYKSGHIITSAAEHKAVLDVCAWLEEQGASVTYLKPKPSGAIELEQVQSARQENTVLVSLMHVNNETGAITDVAKIGAWCREQNLVFHVDAAQSAGKLPIDLSKTHIDLLSLSAHKMYGPKGIGALFVRRAENIELVPQIHGGGHERKMRSGTLATHQIAGLGAAAELASELMVRDQENARALRATFLSGLKALPGLHINVDGQDCIASTVNISFGKKNSEEVLLALRGLAVSSGSACTSASVEPSHVLTAMGFDRQQAESAIRFSFGRYTTQDDVHNAVACVKKAVSTLGL